MDSIQKLLRQVRRKQLLICAYRPDLLHNGQAPALEDITSLLNMTAAECLPLVNRLQAKGLIVPVPEIGPSSVRLTPKGLRLVERMSRAANGPRRLEAAPQASPRAEIDELTLTAGVAS